MDLLSRRSRAGRAYLAGLLLLACAGCTLFDAFGGSRRALVFGHDVHVEGEGLRCLNCHEDAQARPEPGMPRAEGCSICHDVLDEEVPPGRRVGQLFDPDGSFRARRVSTLDDEVEFDHLAHVESVETCAECHTGIESSRAVDDRLAVDMAACVRCHQERSAPAECSTCHSVIDVDWEPPSHALDWVHRHGALCRAADADLEAGCYVCHDESSCAQCHRIEPPRSHNVHWRLRGHGVSAWFERQSCATCHESHDCDACHAEARPRNHVGAFGGARSSHCISCHFPLTSSGCVTCHQGTPSHATGPAQPDWHDPTFDCRSCHGQAGLPLLHFDDGSNCNICHS